MPNQILPLAKLLKQKNEKILVDIREQYVCFGELIEVDKTEYFPGSISFRNERHEFIFQTDLFTKVKVNSKAMQNLFDAVCTLFQTIRERKKYPGISAKVLPDGVVQFKFISTRQEVEDIWEHYEDFREVCNHICDITVHAGNQIVKNILKV